jgi:aminomethyltransferase
MAFKTALHERTSALCQSYQWLNWNNHVLPGTYSGDAAAEALAVRHHAGIFDLSPFAKYHISGLDAEAYLDQMLTRDLRRVAVGRGVYALWCNPEGQVLQEGVVLRRSSQDFLVCATYPDIEWWRNNAQGYQVDIIDRSLTDAVIALQGKQSAKILQQVAEFDCNQLPYFGVIQTRLAGIPCTVSRTGYTGDLGYEIWVETEQAIAIWDVLWEAGYPYGLQPCGLLALDILRVEAGFVMAGDRQPFEFMSMGDFCGAAWVQNQTEAVTPYELDLKWAVELDKPDFIGCTALRKVSQQGHIQQLVGLEILSKPFEQLYKALGISVDYPPKVAQWVVPLFLEGTDHQVGHVTSRVYSPYLQKYIAQGFLDCAVMRSGAAIEMECTVLRERRRTPIQVVERPFLNLPHARRARPLLEGPPFDGLPRIKALSQVTRSMEMSKSVG